MVTNQTRHSDSQSCINCFMHRGLIQIKKNVYGQQRTNTRKKMTYRVAKYFSVWCSLTLTKAYGSSIIIYNGQYFVAFKYAHPDPFLFFNVRTFKKQLVIDILLYRLPNIVQYKMTTFYLDEFLHINHQTSIQFSSFFCMFVCSSLYK